MVLFIFVLLGFVSLILSNISNDAFCIIIAIGLATSFIVTAIKDQK